MQKLPRITADDLTRALAKAGWNVVRQKGSHIQLRHPDKKGRVTVALHAGAIIKPKTLLGTLNQAGMTVEELRRLL
ncbi:MAG TPA: type II toxin-antitoxin system HicA family toxin [Chloroflexota bacterium]|nr:type II toxin-antitoxin system HicA family toxin [Chloroflexota bacterium]